MVVDSFKKETATLKLQNTLKPRQLKRCHCKLIQQTKRIWEEFFPNYLDMKKEVGQKIMTPAYLA
jgi:hypothetical protein